MGTIPAFPAFTAGEIPTAAKMNQAKTAGDFWALTPRCSVYANATQSINNTAYVLVTAWDNELYDIVQSGDSPMHDTVTNPERLYIRTTGKYLVSGQIVFASNATGYRGLNLRLNSAGNPASGTSLVFSQQGAINGADTSVMVPPVVWAFSAGDYLEVFARQNSAGALNLSAGRSVTFLTVKLDSA